MTVEASNARWIEELVGKLPASPTAAPLGDSRIEWSEFWHRERSEQDFLVDPLIAAGRGHALYAPGGVGKSLLLGDVAAGLASGRKTLHREAGEPVTVVYLDYEMTEDDVYERLTDMEYGADTDLGALHYHLLPAIDPLDTPTGGDELVAHATGVGAQLVVIDTFSRAVSGPENDSDTVRAFYRCTGANLKRAGIAYVRLDHAGKDPTRGQRGSSAKQDDVDIVWQLTVADGNALNLRAMKRRVRWVPERLILERRDGPLVHVPSLRGWPAGTKDLAERLDRLDVPVTLGREQTRKVLREHDQHASNELLTAAIRYRRERLVATDSLTDRFSDD